VHRGGGEWVEVRGTGETYLRVVLRWCESDGLDEDAV
jgi:hypothetical protein